MPLGKEFFLFLSELISADLLVSLVLSSIRLLYAIFARHLVLHAVSRFYQVDVQASGDASIGHIVL